LESKASALACRSKAEALDSSRPAPRLAGTMTKAHFLNAILGADLPSPVTQVDILNPYNEREFITDKLSIVDVKARDDHARLYQAEIQLRK
jgi:hypothetical protein